MRQHSRHVFVCARAQGQDVSADLVELRTSPLVVVCAGVKSILDIARTLEYLETQGVPVVSYQTNDFPAFFSPTSGLPSPARLDTPQEVRVCGILICHRRRRRCFMNSFDPCALSV